jgi:hypothetical protein
VIQFNIANENIYLGFRKLCSYGSIMALSRTQMFPISSYRTPYQLIFHNNTFPSNSPLNTI